ncbi:polysaccharide deacetylase family protein [Streptosporangium sp. NBC_01639]|uniref:polysaccharide deacetylase family protein n=1 Tax=Streptosporangium sp. NBC_01639 TaxID=2975948 RepID=UPI003865D34E|nr:polysaccharide deacetylase family protein [Streptosporangium sp. NBC_01639]
MIRVPILMYHSVSDHPNDETRPLAVSPGRFADQLGMLRDRGFTPMTLSDLVAGMHRTSAMPDRPVAITFDDGYADFHTEALPVLERFGYPATVFVTSGWVQDSGPAEAGRRLAPMLTWSQVREAVSCGVEIGGHSHSHPQLDQLPGGELRNELRTNKAMLEDQIGRPVATMAYPYGYSSARVRREVRKAGYWTACAVANDTVREDDEMLALPRLTVTEQTSMAKFSKAIDGQSLSMIYLKERALTKGYAVVRRTRYGLRRISSKYTSGQASGSD